jgi:hypothetical protein
VLRAALEALTFRWAAAGRPPTPIIRKRTVLHGTLGYAAEAGMLPDNPLDSIGWLNAGEGPAQIAARAGHRDGRGRRPLYVSDFRARPADSS